MYAQSNHPSIPHSEQIQASTHQQQTPHVRCANCDIEILWPAIVVQSKPYCCTGCASGGPCNCDYSLYRSVNISGVIHYGVESIHEHEQ